MSVSDHRRFDASLDAAGEHELLQYVSDAELASRFHEITQIDTGIAGLLAGSIDDEVMIGLVLNDIRSSETRLPPPAVEPLKSIAIPASVLFRGKRQKRRGPLLALAAALAGLLAAGAVFFHHAPAPAAPTKIASMRGEVHFIGRSGEVSLASGQPLEDGGTVTTVGPDSRATLALNDGTEIALLGDTSFTLESAPGKRRLFLETGVLRSTVPKQSEEAPLIFGTSEATATVRGTELAIVKDDSGTYLIVTRGAVALRRSFGGPEVVINAGYYGHVEPEGAFYPWPITRLPKDLRERALLQN